jgi:hypothetical protein
MNAAEMQETLDLAELEHLLTGDIVCANTYCAHEPATHWSACRHCNYGFIIGPICINAYRNRAVPGWRCTHCNHHEDTLDALVTFRPI